MTIVGYLLNLACWKRTQVRLLNQNQIWGKIRLGLNCKGLRSSVNKKAQQMCLSNSYKKRRKMSKPWDMLACVRAVPRQTWCLQFIWIISWCHRWTWGEPAGYFRTKMYAQHSISLLTSQSLTSVRTYTGVGTWSSFRCVEIRNVVIHHCIALNEPQVSCSKLS